MRPDPSNTAAPPKGCYRRRDGFNVDTDHRPFASPLCVISCLGPCRKPFDTGSVRGVPRIAGIVGGHDSTGHRRYNAGRSSLATTTFASTAVQLPSPLIISVLSIWVAGRLPGISLPPAPPAIRQKEPSGTADRSVVSPHQIIRTLVSPAAWCAPPSYVNNGLRRRRPRRIDSHQQWWNGPEGWGNQRRSLFTGDALASAVWEPGRRPAVGAMIKIHKSTGGATVSERAPASLSARRCLTPPDTDVR
jgi:hypothetical protein